jgi:hypothetical protein
MLAIRMKLAHVTLLVPTILMWVLNFEKFCGLTPDLLCMGSTTLDAKFSS